MWYELGVKLAAEKPKPFDPVPMQNAFYSALSGGRYDPSNAQAQIKPKAPPLPVKPATGPPPPPQPIDPATGKPRPMPAPPPAAPTGPQISVTGRPRQLTRPGQTVAPTDWQAEYEDKPSTLGQTAGDVLAGGAQGVQAGHAVGSGVGGLGKAVAPSMWSRLGNWASGVPGAGPVSRLGGRVASFVPYAGMAADAWNSWKTRKPGGEIAEYGGSTPEEKAYLANVKDPEAWKMLPEGYDAANTWYGNANAVEGAVTHGQAGVGGLPGAGSAVMQTAPSWIAGMNRWWNDDPREAFYNPQMALHFMGHSSPEEVDFSSLPKAWNSIGRPLGSGLRNLWNRPIQTSTALGAGIWNQLSGGAPMRYDPNSGLPPHLEQQLKYYQDQARRAQPAG